MIIGLILMLAVAGCQSETATESDAADETAAATVVPTVELEPTVVVDVEPTAVSQVTDVLPATPVPEPTAVPQETAVSTAANADVVYVKADETAVGTWRFSVSVDHPDTGWEDYADGWDVLLPDGTILKPAADSPFTRLLVHPHVGERPFIRSQSNLIIPADVAAVTVRAHDLVDGWGGKEIVVQLTAVTGDGYEVNRLGE